MIPPWPVACLVGALALTASGCGTGEYNRRLKATAGEFASRIDLGTILFGTASPLQDAAGASVGASLRMPTFVVNQAVAGDSAQPPSMKLPGFAYAYPVDSGNIYIAAVPVDKAVGELKSEVKAEVGKAIAGADWTDAQVPTEDGAAVTIPRISGSDGANRFDLYLLTSSTHHVLIGWRAPADNSAFFQASEYSMGTVMVAGG